MPKIAIITTTYKHEKFIEETIESILSQSFTDWELLIGDDSPDTKSWEIIQSYVAKYPDKIKAWHHTPNRGIVGNMNFLLERVSAEIEYIAFLEGDDMYTADNLEKKLEVFTTYPEIQLVYNDLSFINSASKIFIKSFFNFRNIPFYQNALIPVSEFFLLPAGPIASWSSGMVRRAMYTTFGIKNRTQGKTYSTSDYEFYYHVATNHPVFGMSEPLTLYRRHTENLSGKD
jgi:glycosyltransferase involved in cell wall biosynthesis